MTTRIQQLFEHLWYPIVDWLPVDYGTYLFVRLAVYVLAYVSKWLVLLLAIGLLLPSCFLPSETAVKTTAAVMPALMVSIFVFTVGAFFVAVQQATAIHSNRAGLLLLVDPRAHDAVVRPLLLSGATLLLALLAPEQDAPPLLAGFAVVLVLATVSTLVGAARLLPELMTRVTAPINFAEYATASVEYLLELDETDHVVYRVGLLGEMLRRGVQSGDSVQIRAALGALVAVSEAYMRATRVTPSARVHEHRTGTATGWLADELVGSLVSAGQSAVGGDIANEDTNAIAAALADFGVSTAAPGHPEEFRRCTDGLAELATCTQQVRGPGLVNIFVEPLIGLAKLAQAARNHHQDDESARALATWALAMTYQIRYLSPPGAPEHPMWQPSLALLSAAPFDEAHRVIDSESFQRAWTNKLAALWPEVDTSTEPPTEIAPGHSAAVHQLLRDVEVAAGGASGQPGER